MATKKKSSNRGEVVIPEALNTPDFTAAWAEWLKLTTERGTPLADEDTARQLKLLAKLGPEKAIADICKTMDEHRLGDQRPAQADPAKKGKGEKAAAKKAASEAAGPSKVTASSNSEKGKKAKIKEEPKAKKMSALDAAAKVLEEKGEAMNCQEMIDAMSAQGLWKSPGGLTPASTLYSAILREMTKKGSAARFRKSERGRFVRM